MDGLWPQPLSEKDAQGKNPLALAFAGDAVWALLTRQELLRSDLHVNELHRRASNQVNAGAQARALERALPLLTEREQDVARRGMNAHCKHLAPKNQDPVDYRKATGLEALFGYLYLSGQLERTRELYEATLPNEAGDDPHA